MLLSGLALFAAGTVSLLESRLGLSPWDVLHQGISRHTPLTFGEATVAVSVVVLAGAWRLGARVGVGTVANAVLVGSLVQLYTSFGAVQGLAHDPLGVRIGLLAAGLALDGRRNGAVSRRRARRRAARLADGRRRAADAVPDRGRPGRARAVRARAGIALGGTFGVGTIAFAARDRALGRMAFWLLARSPLGGRWSFRPLPSRRCRAAPSKRPAIAGRSSLLAVR